MLTLGIDTALHSCSAAILRQGAVLFEKFIPLAKGHAEFLAPLVADTLAGAGVAPSDISRIGVVVGPGGFTGARVGISFAQGFAAPGGVDLVGVSTFDAFRASADPGLAAPAGVVIDARRGEVYAALYDVDGSLLVDGFVAAPEKAAARLAAAAPGGALMGGGAPIVAESLPGWRVLAAPAHISAAAVARLAERAAPPFATPGPIYLRAPDAKPGLAGVLAALTS